MHYDIRTPLQNLCSMRSPPAITITVQQCSIDNYSVPHPTECVPSPITNRPSRIRRRYIVLHPPFESWPTAHSPFAPDAIKHIESKWMNAPQGAELRGHAG